MRRPHLKRLRKESGSNQLPVEKDVAATASLFFLLLSYGDAVRGNLPICKLPLIYKLGSTGAYPTPVIKSITSLKMQGSLRMM